MKKLKTQDYGYIVHKKAVDDSKVKKMKDNLHMIGEKTSTKRHKIFLDDKEQLESFDPVQHFETTPELYEQGYNRLRKAKIEAMAENDEIPSALTVKKVLDKKSKAYKELDQRSRRAGKLDKALEKLTEQRNIMGKGSKRKVTVKGANGEESTQYKWKRRRQK